MADVCKVEWAPAAGKVLAGEYTLSRGITPSIITLTCVPFTGQIPAISDVSFVCGGTTLKLADCGFASKAKSFGGSGRIWTIQLYDARWKWLYGMYVRTFNTIRQARLLGNPGSVVMAEGESDETDSARDIALQILRDELRIADFNADALPANEYPAFSWDYVRPAQALAELCDLYQLTIAYNPFDNSVKLCKAGEGDDLPNNARVLSDEVADAERLKPKSLRAVCAPTMHEEEFELEAVGMDLDGTIVPIDRLSYKPANGWGSDFLFMSDVPDDEVADPENSTKLISIRKIAEECVFRWYRIKPPTSGRLWGWRKDNAERVTYRKLLPISGDLVSTYIVPGKGLQAGLSKTRQQQASVCGIHAADYKAMGQTNSGLSDAVKESFTLDCDQGIVKFSQPVFKWDSGAIDVPTLYLRCVVRGDRYDVKTRDIGGAHGVEMLDCSHLVLKYRDQADVNKAEIDAAIEAIFDAKAADYGPADSGSRSYAGLEEIKLGGKIAQVTWTVGPGGAVTEASQNAEHEAFIPSEDARRQMERLAVPTWRKV